MFSSPLRFWRLCRSRYLCRFSLAIETISGRFCRYFPFLLLVLLFRNGCRNLNTTCDKCPYDFYCAFLYLCYYLSYVFAFSYFVLNKLANGKSSCESNGGVWPRSSAYLVEPKEELICMRRVPHILRDSLSLSGEENPTAV